MKTILFLAVPCLLFIPIARGQSKEVAQPPHAAQTAPAPNPPQDSEDVAELRADIQHLKVLLNQMRTNLAFVDTSPSPLKHQFELEADAWQMIVDRMDRRLKQVEERKAPR